MRLLRLLIIIAMIAVPVFAQQSWQGVWDGTTSQSKPISIAVDGTNRIPSLSFSGQSQTPGCPTQFNGLWNFISPANVNSDGTFTVNAPSTAPGSVGLTISGTLTSGGSGSGTVTFNYNTCPGCQCGGSGTANFNLTRQGGPPGAAAAILAVVGSLQGNAFFRTGVQIYNPGATSISGRFVFHPAGTSGTPTDPSMAYTLLPEHTIEYPDLLPAMGLSGLGSLDIVTSDPVPIMVARVFSDAGEAGTAGFTFDPLAPAAALQGGEKGVIIMPPDLVKARLNIGLRSLDTGASMTITLRRSNGAQKGTVARSMLPNFFEQVSVAALLPGLFLEGSDTITFSINSGNVIIYGASTDNRTQDPSLQYAKKTF